MNGSRTALLLALSVAACTDSSHSPAPLALDGGADAAADASVPARVHVEFTSTDPHAFGALPFPSDLFLDADGHVIVSTGLDRIATSNPQILGNGLAGTEGFGRQGSG